MIKERRGDREIKEEKIRKKEVTEKKKNVELGKVNFMFS